jgi:hypothetical protein
VWSTQRGHQPSRPHSPHQYGHKHVARQLQKHGHDVLCMGRHDRGVTTTYLWGEKKCYWLNAPPTESETRVVLCSPFRPTGSTSPYPVLVMVVIVKYLPSQHSGISSTGAQNTLRMSPKAPTGMLHPHTTSHILHEGAGCTLWGTSATVHSRGQHSTCHHLQGHKIPMPQGVSVRARDVGVGAVLGQPVVVPCLNSPHAQEVPAAHTKSMHTQHGCTQVDTKKKPGHTNTAQDTLSFVDVGAFCRQKQSQQRPSPSRYGERTHHTPAKRLITSAAPMISLIMDMVALENTRMSSRRSRI